MKRNKGNKSRAARELGMARNTLRFKLSKYGVGSGTTNG
jgi:DNA-binding protein Fis